MEPRVQACVHQAKRGKADSPARSSSVLEREVAQGRERRVDRSVSGRRRGAPRPNEKVRDRHRHGRGRRCPELWNYLLSRVA